MTLEGMDALKRAITESPKELKRWSSDAVRQSTWAIADKMRRRVPVNEGTLLGAIEAKVPAGRSVQLGGLVETGSVVRHPDGRVEFTVADRLAASKVVYRGQLPDLFREGQGIVAQGSYRADGVFEARQVLAKHDEKYMPKEVADALKEQGEWHGDEQPAQPGAIDMNAPKSRPTNS